MPIEIDGNQYFRAREVADEFGVSRQTLWRWRLENKIPPGHRFRDRQILFTDAEVEAIRQFAFRLEPALPAGARQLGLFNGRRGKANGR